MDSQKQKIMVALGAFVAQRPGLGLDNYGDVRAYRAESRRIARDLRDYRALERYVLLRDSITADDIAAAARSAYSGRLTINPEGIEYCAGQDWPTEYRRAACAVLAEAIWTWFRSDTPDAGAWQARAWHGESGFLASIQTTRAAAEADLAALGGCGRGYVQELVLGYVPGDYARAAVRRELGRRIQTRWFG